MRILFSRTHRTAGARAFVLVSVIVVILMASMVAISLLFRLKAEDTAAATGAGSEQAWAAALSGVYEAIRIAAAAQPGDLDWQSNPAVFRDQLVTDDGVDGWYFSVFTEGGGGDEAIRYGLTDEASKLNVNTVTNELLTRLGMTPYLAQGLSDFIDADNDPHPEGAEQDYYDTLASPYGVWNQSLSSLYELFLVRGFTPRIVYGEDANLNFLLDANEDDGDERFPPDNGDGRLFSGVRNLLTACSYDLDEDNTGVGRYDPNTYSGDFKELGFSPALITYINNRRSNNLPIHHPAELVDVTTNNVELALVLDKLSAAPNSSDPFLHGLLNVNTASAQILRALPEVDEALADSIVSARKALTPEQRKTPAWLYPDVLDAAKFKALAPRLTTRSLQFRFHVIGYGIPSGRYRVLEAIIDVASGEPAVSYLRDITKLGLPFALPIEKSEGTSFVRSRQRKQTRPGHGKAINRVLTSRLNGLTKEMPNG